MKEFLEALEAHPLISIVIVAIILLVLVYLIRMVIWVVKGGGEIGPIKGAKRIQHSLEYDRKMKTIVTEATLQDNILLANQMKIVEEQVEKAISKMREVHLDLLISKLKDDEEARKDDASERYQHITEIVRKRLIDRFRIAMRENHFAEKTESEFFQYMKDKLEEYYSMVESIIDNGYKHSVISVIELREEQRRYSHIYGEYLQIVFMSARGLAFDKDATVKKLWGDYNAIQEHYIRTGEVLGLVSNLKPFSGKGRRL